MEQHSDRSRLDLDSDRTAADLEGGKADFRRRRVVQADDAFVDLGNRFPDERSATVSTSVPAAPQEGQLPNHCNALAPQSEQT